MQDDTHPEILSPDDSALWRQAYLDVFINTSSEKYQRDIASLREFSDGFHHVGYLWDYLLSPSRITIQRFYNEVVHYAQVLVMADNHSRDRVPGAPLWPYPLYSVVLFKPPALLQSLDSLP